VIGAAHVVFRAMLDVVARIGRGCRRGPDRRRLESSSRRPCCTDRSLGGDRLRDEPRLRVRYFCSSHYENSALYPVTAQLERAAGLAREDPTSTRAEKFRTLLAQSAATDEETALIGELLSLPLPEGGATAQLTPQRKKEKTLEALLRQMEVLAENRPLLLVWEDIHWIDPTSRELLDLTISRVRNLSVLLIITYRPEFEPPWTGQAHVGLLSLSRLDAQDGTALAERVAGKALPPAIVARIAARADGIPLFVEELRGCAGRCVPGQSARQYEGQGPMDFAAFTGTQEECPWRLSDVIPARMVCHTLRTWTCSHLTWRGQSSRPPAVSPSRVRPTAVSAVGTMRRAASTPFSSPEARWRS
jgi:hypothetical protein